MSKLKPQTKDAMSQMMMALMAAIRSHIFTFFHHMALLRFLLARWNFFALWFRASVLSTRSSIFSPRARTCDCRGKGVGVEVGEEGRGKSRRERGRKWRR